MDGPNSGTVHGIHHITAICGDAQENLDFYAGVLGMRLVKRSVNQDDPGTYHLFYADAEGHPGSDLTFFPWANMPPGRMGSGLTVEVPLAVPPDSLGYWAERLAQHGVETGSPVTRFDERTLPVRDPHGLELALVETGDRRQFTPWDGSPVPQERQIRGLHSARILERDMARTSQFLRDALGFEPLAKEDGWVRFGVVGGGSGNIIEVREVRDQPMGQWGVGSVHHIAYRVPDDEAQLAMRTQVIVSGGRPTEVIDRFWFKSIYFKEPGGVLFEIATDGPGFAKDEDPAHLGEQLILPPWLEQYREAIEKALPTLSMPTAPVS
jgi:glyoxalase family protein